MIKRLSDLEGAARMLVSYAEVNASPHPNANKVVVTLTYDAPGLLAAPVVVKADIPRSLFALGDMQAIVKRLDDAAKELDYRVLRSGVLKRAAELAAMVKRGRDWSNLSEAAKDALEGGWLPTERDPGADG